jgi:hypothetical protein
MMKKTYLEMIAERYNVKVSYTKPGKGGFILDSSDKIYKRIEDVFGYEVDLFSTDYTYTFDAISLEAA